MKRWLCGVFLLLSWTTAQDAESLAQKYVEAFNAKDSAAILSLYDNPSTQQYTKFLLPFAFDRLTIDPQSVRVVEQGNQTALVYLNYLPAEGHWIPGTLLFIDVGNGYDLSYSDLSGVLRRASPFLSFRLDLQQTPKLWIPIVVIGLVLGLSIFASLRWMKASSKPPLFLYENSKALKGSSDTWGLAVGAIYRSWWGLPLDKIATPHQGLVDYTAHEWNIHNRDHLLQTLVWLYQYGHRDKFKTLSASYKEANDDHLAWDMVQYINLCLAGASVGYLHPHEATNLILHASHRLQKQYSSWQAFSKAFQRERFLWRRLTLQPITQDLQNLDAGQDAILQKLLKHKNSPWKKVKWGTQLEPLQANDFFTNVLEYYAIKQKSEEVTREDGILN
jgi:hypothetical protein